MVVLSGFTVWAFSQALGNQLISYKPKDDDGYRTWMKGGYEFVGCKGDDYSDVYYTPCMVQANFTAAEKSLHDLGVDVKFQYDLQYTDFAGYDVACAPGGSDCLHDIVYAKWQPKGHDVLFLPRGNGASGSTKVTVDGKSVTGLNSGKSQLFQVAHLLRHELGHVMGFDFHLYDQSLWSYQGCGEKFTVKPYAQSGLAKDCANDTFLGTWMPDDSSKCAPKYDSKDPYWVNWNLYGAHWNVPVYGDVFKKVFGCWVSQQGGVKPPDPVPPGPAPTPVCAYLLEQLKAQSCKL